MAIKLTPRNEEARTMEAGFSNTVFCGRGRYADRGDLLPLCHNELAVQPGVTALPYGWPAM